MLQVDRVQSTSVIYLNAVENTHWKVFNQTNGPHSFLRPLVVILVCATELNANWTWGPLLMRLLVLCSHRVNRAVLRPCRLGCPLKQGTLSRVLVSLLMGPLILHSRHIQLIKLRLSLGDRLIPCRRIKFKCEVSFEMKDTLASLFPLCKLRNNFCCF